MSERISVVAFRKHYVRETFVCSDGVVVVHHPTHSKLEWGQRFCEYTKLREAFKKRIRLCEAYRVALRLRGEL